MHDDDGAGLRRQLSNEDAIRGGLEPSFPKYWNQPDVRGILYAQQGSVCAYCSSALMSNDRGDVDHFRPTGPVVDDLLKRSYWWLAYEMTNYLLSCRVCNSSNKGSRFPLRRGATRRASFGSEASHAREARLLMDPGADEPERMFHYDWERPMCLVRAAQGQTRSAREQVEGVITFFRLNVNPRLVRERTAVRDCALEFLQSGDEARARSMATRYQPHSALVLQVLVDQGVEPPSLVDECMALAQILVESLVSANELATTFPMDRRLQADIDETRWSLVYLLEYSPACDVAGFYHELEQFYDDSGVLDSLLELRQTVWE